MLLFITSLLRHRKQKTKKKNKTSVLSDYLVDLPVVGSIRMAKVTMNAWTHPQDEQSRPGIWHMAELHDSRPQPVALYVKIVGEHHYRLAKKKEISMVVAWFSSLVSLFLFFFFGCYFCGCCCVLCVCVFVCIVVVVCVFVDKVSQFHFSALSLKI